MGVTRNLSTRLTVLEVYEEDSVHTSVLFTRPANFTFTAGDWMDIGFKDKTLKGGRTYSLSSSPTESDLRITFRRGVSEYKQALEQLHGGECLYITQYGNSYDLQLKKNQSSFLIAGGVGIAPFRSILKQMYDHQDKNDVTLLYLNQTNNFLFKEELAQWDKALPNLTVRYVCTKDIKRKQREKLISSLIKRTDQNFYLSGPPAMVEASEHLLIDLGMRIDDIRIDVFDGY